MSEYVPDTETVREQYTREQPPHIGTVSEKRAEFDRWLRQVKAEAWDECVEAMAWAQQNGPEENALAYVGNNNPYRIESEARP